jgi:hypothetical protein
VGFVPEHRLQYEAPLRGKGYASLAALPPEFLHAASLLAHRQSPETTHDQSHRDENLSQPEI